jgi:hypothetical protein
MPTKPVAFANCSFNAVRKLWEMATYPLALFFGYAYRHAASTSASRGRSHPERCPTSLEPRQAKPRHRIVSSAARSKCDASTSVVTAHCLSANQPGCMQRVLQPNPSLERTKLIHCGLDTINLTCNRERACFSRCAYAHSLDRPIPSPLSASRHQCLWWAAWKRQP